MHAGPTLGQIVRPLLRGSAAAALRLSPQQWKTLRALAACRTGALGGQLFRCGHCQKQVVVAHSCRNRHCPLCQGAQALAWLEGQQKNLLPVPYFHVVFTLPHVLNGLVRQNRRKLFALLFQAVSQTLLKFGRQEWQAQLGITAILHTWSQTLLDHYHLHCIVSAGGVSPDGERWVACSEEYLFNVRALSVVYQAKFLEGLKTLYDTGQLEFHGQLQSLAQPRNFAALARQAAAQKWVVYSKRPFAGPKQVLAYLSRYTHRVAISNRRLLRADASGVTFTYKDYAQGAQQKTMTLEVPEFVRRFCLHVLPERFVKIRHYGLVGNRGRAQRLARARELLDVADGSGEEPAPAPTTPAAGPAPAGRCPFCQQNALVLVGEVSPAWACAFLRLDSS